MRIERGKFLGARKKSLSWDPFVYSCCEKCLANMFVIPSGLQLPLSTKSRPGLPSVPEFSIWICPRDPEPLGHGLKGLSGSSDWFQNLDSTHSKLNQNSGYEFWQSFFARRGLQLQLQDSLKWYNYIWLINCPENRLVCGWKGGFCESNLKGWSDS